MPSFVGILMKACLGRRSVVLLDFETPCLTRRVLRFRCVPLFVVSSCVCRSVAVGFACRGARTAVEAVEEDGMCT